MTRPVKWRNHSLTFQAVSNVADTEGGISSVKRQRTPNNFFGEEEMENTQEHNNGINTANERKPNVSTILLGISNHSQANLFCLHAHRMLQRAQISCKIGDTFEDKHR